MNSSNKKYNLENPKDVQELIDLFENGDWSDIGDIEENEDEEDSLQRLEIPCEPRAGADAVTKIDEQLQERTSEENRHTEDDPDESSSEDEP
ncbi:hypothetical protein JTB14_011373 [Gonioctena quinquepunctata]|nr:hypothetical protein JTB14_011373 [Gonioctena quinquepunctata]